ncbi:LCP family protein [Paenibacillus alkalitolerans]|uniref:LCP family protein n=1 Tax=Paenibacillus alkalitolerans TaxID=2799335 RepID=UPI0018F47811|nr:LCP family protein [Paenibacillus alkalitolerans]
MMNECFRRTASIFILQKKKLLIICSVIVVMLVAGIAFRNAIAASLFRTVVAPKINEELAETYVPIVEEVQPPEKAVKQEPFTFLILGVDQRNKETGRSDTMIFGLFKPDTNILKLISIPRDSYIFLPVEDSYDKASHAFAYGGANSAVRAVEHLLDEPVDYYMSINFQGVVRLIDSIGGIELDISKDLVNDDPSHEHFVVKANQDVYSGVDALNFLRFREDAGGDISRASRNQEFVEAFVKKAGSLDNITKLNELLTIVGDNLQTNMPPSQLTEFIASFIEKEEKNIAINSVTLNGKGARLGDQRLYYLKLDETQLEEIKKQIDSDMGNVVAAAAAID